MSRDGSTLTSFLIFTPNNFLSLAVPMAFATAGSLSSALARPINKLAYGEADLSVLAAAYGFGVARNHAFVDGNKRTALASMIVFLGINGIDLDAPQDAATAVILSLAAGEITEDVLARWIAAHSRPLDAPGIVP